jgi:hypothetical protein
MAFGFVKPAWCGKRWLVFCQTSMVGQEMAVVVSNQHGVAGDGSCYVTHTSMVWQAMAGVLSD